MIFGLPPSGIHRMTGWVANFRKVEQSNSRWEGEANFKNSIFDSFLLQESLVDNSDFRLTYLDRIAEKVYNTYLVYARVKVLWGEK